MKIRKAAVAGTFYPDDAKILRSEINSLLANTHNAVVESAPKILIVPHAGYVYSGPVAAEGYALLKKFAKQISSVVLLGPTHRVPLNGIGMPTASFFQTPLGDIAIDQSSIDKIKDLPFTQFNDNAHAWEHSLEVHLPFLQSVLDQFKLVPLVVGDCPAKFITQVMEILWAKNTLFICSTDLSHFLSYQKAQQIDQQTSNAILNKHSDIQPEQACGCRPLNGVLDFAREKELSIDMIDLKNSGDTAGPKDRVVGYGTYAIH